MATAMIGGHGVARGLALVAAIAGPIWLLADRRAPIAATGPILTLSPAPASPLPARALFAPPPITGDSDAPVSGGAPRLIGIVGRLADAVALLRVSDGATRGLRQGESVDGWTVAEIAADRVRLTRAGRDHVEILPPTS